MGTGTGMEFRLRLEAEELDLPLIDSDLSTPNDSSKTGLRVGAIPLLGEHSVGDPGILQLSLLLVLVLAVDPDTNEASEVVRESGGECDAVKPGPSPT